MSVLSLIDFSRCVQGIISWMLVLVDSCKRAAVEYLLGGGGEQFGI